MIAMRRRYRPDLLLSPKTSYSLTMTSNGTFSGDDECDGDGDEKKEEEEEERDALTNSQQTCKLETHTMSHTYI